MKYKVIKLYPDCKFKIGDILKPIHNYYTTGIWNYYNNPSVFPEFFEEIIEIEKNYEVLSYKHKNTGHTISKRKNGLFLSSVNTENIGYFCESNYINSPNHEIYSIRRISDGEIFTIGDKIIHKNPVRYPIGIITKLETVSDCIFVETNNYENGFNTNISLVNKFIKKPLFTTEDNVEIFEGNIYYYVDISNIHNSWIVKNDKAISIINYNNNDIKIFSTKEATEDYIIMNKPCISLQEILDKAYLNKPIYKLKELVKSKL